MSGRTVVTFFALTFALAWGLIVLLLLFTARIEAIFGPVGYTNPLFILAVWSPGIAGAFLVFFHYGIRGLLSFFRRLTLWRMPLAWWAFLAIAVILTPMFNAARGSILIAALFHFQMNNPIWSDAQPWENYIFAIVAVVIVVVNREAMLSREGAVTEVLAPGNVKGRR